jgi:HAD superfamily hydrolase (TIGR01509 family)
LFCGGAADPGVGRFVVKSEHYLKFMFKAILFDFDGTLVDFVASDIHSLKWLHSHLDSTVGFDDFLETSVDEIMRFHHLVTKQEVDPLLMHEFRLRNTFIRHKMAWDDDYVALYRNKLFETCVPFDGVEQLLAAVKRKTRTGLITNAYDAIEQRERIRSSGLEAYFDVIVIAGDIGIYKPDPSIFLYALSLIEAEPDETLYIGDSVTHDIVGAKSAGMKAVLLGKQSNRGAGIADYVVSGIDELQELLGQEV